MAHAHSIYDTDPHFAINAKTRAIVNKSETKTVLIQYDHNSERFTFELPRMIDGHDMDLCNVVRVHYCNIDAVTKAMNKDVYEVRDLRVFPGDNDVVVCSWLVSRNATQLVGTLSFLLEFSCVSNGVAEYTWHTAVYSGISVSTGMSNDEAVVTDYADILQQWRDTLLGTIEPDVTLTRVGVAAEAAAVGAGLGRKAPAIPVDASGDVVSITDGAAMPALSLVSHITAVQSGEGDPSPDNVRPITGWSTASLTRTGKNIVDINANETTSGVTVTAKDGLVTVDGTVTSGNWAYVRLDTLNLKPGTYSMSHKVISGSVSNAAENLTVVIGHKGASSTVAARTRLNDTTSTFTLTEDTEIALKFMRGGVGVTYDNYKFSVQIEMGTTVTDHEQPQRQTLTADLPETVYGGTLDWKTGLLTVTPYVLMESPVPTGAGVREASNGAKYVTVDLAGYDKCSDSAKVLCSHYRTAVGLSTSGAIRYVSGQFFVYDDSATADNYTTLLEGVQILYPAVGDAKTVQLTPQQLTMLYGTNNVWSSDGATDVTYAADTKMYIDAKIAALAAAQVNN